MDKQRIAFILLGAQAASWGVMSLVDYIEEKSANDFQLITVFAVPSVIAVMYFLFRRKIYQNRDAVSWKAIAGVLFSWLGITGCITVVVSWMVTHNIWIVHQNIGFFNGIEYPIFGMLLGVITLAAALMGEVGIWIWKKCSRK